VNKEEKTEKRISGFATTVVAVLTAITAAVGLYHAFFKPTPPCPPQR
jgi:hypothetical protein